MTTLPAGLLAVAMTRVGSGEGFLAAWLAVAGADVGLAMATAVSAALSELPTERERGRVGGPAGGQERRHAAGAAIFGSVLSTGYRASLFGGLAVADRLGLVAWCWRCCSCPGEPPSVTARNASMSPSPDPLPRLVVSE